MKKDKTYIKHIAEAIGKIENYLTRITYKSFVKNDMLIDVLIRELAVIGEAANKISNKFKKANPELPYKDMVAMRNFIIHEYFDVNKKIIWDTCKYDLEKIKKILK